MPGRSSDFSHYRRHSHPCSTFIPYLKGVGQGAVLFWWALIRAVATTGAVAYGAIDGSLVEAMIWLCIVNAVTLVGYSWVVFRADSTPFLKGLFISSRPMIAALLMALVVRFLLEHFGAHVPNAVLQLIAGTAIGSVIYTVLILLTERSLLRRLLDMARARKPRAAPAGAAE